MAVKYVTLCKCSRKKLFAELNVSIFLLLLSFVFRGCRLFIGFYVGLRKKKQFSMCFVCTAIETGSYCHWFMLVEIGLTFARIFGTIHVDMCVCVCVLGSQYSIEKICHILFFRKWYVSACFSFVTIEQYKLVFISQKLFVLYHTIYQAQKGSGYDLMEAIDFSLHISTIHIT